MKFENDFDVEAPIEEVFKALLDVERVAPCVPGAEVVEHTDEDVYKVAIKVKVGPMSMKYGGEVKIVESDPEQHRAVMRTRAKEARGQGTADANVEMHLEGDESRTHGHISTDVKLSGRAAAMGGSVIQDVSARIVDTFAENLAAMLSEGKSAAVETPAAPATGVSVTSAPVPSTDDSSAGEGEKEKGAMAAAAGREPSIESAADATREPANLDAEAAATGGPEPRPVAEPATTDGAEQPTPEAPPAAASDRQVNAGSAEPPPSGGGQSPEQDASLPVLSIAGSVIAGRLRDPRALGAALGAVAIVAFALGRRGR
jgi:carbon monoxide dehydrogenase subunit G